MRRCCLVAVLVALLGPTSAAAQTVDVLVVQSGSAAPYEAARRGLERALPERIRVERMRMDPEHPEEDGARVSGLRPRVIATIGTQATSWALRHTRETPIVFSMVLHPVTSGFVRSFGRPGSRVTGAALDVPPGRHFQALRQALGARRIGVLYNPSRTAGVIAEARRDARREGVDLVVREVSDAAALERALGALRGIDALWSVPDRTVFSKGAAEKVLLYTLRNRIPFMGLSEQYVRAGALLALSVSYEENGRQAGERVLRVVRGDDPGAIPVARPESVELVFNPHTAERLGIPIRPPARMGLRPMD